MARPKRNKDSRAVREPLQVYLDRDDRAMLDRLAKETGLSRAEVLRRGIRSFAAEHAPETSPMLQFLQRIAAAQWPAGMPGDIGERHDDYLAESYLDTHEDAK